MLQNVNYLFMQKIYNYATLNTTNNLTFISPGFFNEYYSLLRKKYYNTRKQKLQDNQLKKHRRC